MAAFNVIKILDGNTIEVSPGWTWNNEHGNLVKISGYKVAPEYNSFAQSKLTTLILNKSVELKNATKTEIAHNSGRAITCSVYLNEIDISLYFPELKHV